MTAHSRAEDKFQGEPIHRDPIRFLCTGQADQWTDVKQSWVVQDTMSIDLDARTIDLPLAAKSTITEIEDSKIWFRSELAAGNVMTGSVNRITGEVFAIWWLATASQPYQPYEQMMLACHRAERQF